MTELKTRKLEYLSPADLKPDPCNPRKHSRPQVRAVAKSIKQFSFAAPILVDKHRTVVAGHCRLEAAKLLGLEQVPVICLDDLSEAKAKAYMLADNKLNDRSTWDDEMLARQLKELSEMVIDFDLEDTGFELPEIDLLIQGLDEQPEADALDEFSMEAGPAVTRPRDLWHLGDHRLLCGSALDQDAYGILLGGEKAASVISDPPYNLRVDGISGRGKTLHREFAMASGEMTSQEFTRFLTAALGHIQKHTPQGALIYSCMDWRHVGELLAAGKTTSLELQNICVWVKTNGGMGTLYRSQHELVFVFRNGSTPHRNNVQLGKFGRNRSNVWHYPGANSFGGRGKEQVQRLHPTVKPTGLVADAILDCTALGEIVLDPFAGSGTMFLAAERTGRRGYGIELDPLHVDTAIQRWRRMTGQQAYLASGSSFDDVNKERNSDEG